MVQMADRIKQHTANSGGRCTTFKFFQKDSRN